MNKSSVSIALFTALYGTATLSAATSLAPNEIVHSLQQPNFTNEQINNIQAGKSKKPTASTVLANDGLNIQINSQKEKFIEEADIEGEHIYVVRLKDQPTSLYKGGIAGLAATHVDSLKSEIGVSSLYKAGKATSDRVTAYNNYLKDKQRSAISAMENLVGSKQLRKQYTTAVNAFTVTMTQAEAKRIAQLSEVAYIHRAKTYELQTDAGPQKIGADKIWAGTTESNVAYKGEGIIMGIIDTGINTDHRSFADVGDDGYDHTNPWGDGVYVGACAEEGQENLCNDKLIGVRSYAEITDAFDDMIPGHPAIGEDYQGHGSHVASTSVGNVLTDVDFLLPDFAAKASDGILVKEGMFPQISGVAPHANIVSYQVCHVSNDSGYRGCPWEAMMGGIEDAIKDGVDVINFSIGGQDRVSPWDDGIELGFLAAREAGISVAVAAGNGGQDGAAEYFGSIDHASPWLVSVAATTHDRKTKVETAISFEGFANDESGAPLGSEIPAWSDTGLVGGSINEEPLTGVVVWSKDYEDIDGNKDYGGYCGTEYPAGTFNFYKDGTPIVGAESGDTNVIVVCQRNNLNDPNGVARTLKSDNVKAGGADGFIMYNYAKGDSTPIVSYSLPSVHLTREAWDGEYLGYNHPDNTEGLEDWIDSYSEKGHTITIGKTFIGNEYDEANGDWLAPFSSRGPSTSTQEMLIPQLAAPGVNIYAAFADEHPFNDTGATTDFNAISGTSMASPHVAGAMALIRQAHPDWTATEVQSALMLTADNVVRYRRLNEVNGDIGEAFIYRAGAGRINVAEAIDTGLVMDESIENFRAANPGNGGQVHRLNIPQLVNFECKPTCQWTRTFKATKDGSWEIDHSDVVNWAYDLRTQTAQNGVNINATPSAFTLKKGESQTVVFEASIMDTQDMFSNAEVELHSDVILTETTGASTEAHLPLAFKFSKNGMPARLAAVAHRNEGSFQFNNLELPPLDTPYTQVYAPVKADIKTISLPKDDDAYFPWSMNTDMTVPMSDRIDEATHVEMISVPANAKRLIVESQGTVESEINDSFDKGNILVFVGKDYNGNGEADPFEEILCMSSHIMFNNFCNINNPEEGEYWAVFYNSGKLRNGVPVYPDLAEEVFSYAIAVVTDEVSGQMSLDVEPTDGKETVSAVLNFAMPDMVPGDLYYSMLDFGTSEINAGNVGKVGFKLERGKNDVNLDVTQTVARAGDVVPYTFEVLANDTGADRSFSITVEMPEGLSFTAEDILASSDAVEDVSIEGNVITISGTQPNTADVVPGYIMSTNLEDEMCRMPNFGNSNPGGYVDLAEFNINPIFSGFKTGIDQYGRPADNNIYWRDGLEISVAAMFNGAYDSFHLYNNTDQLNTGKQNYISLRGNGLIDLWAQPTFWPYHFKFPYDSFPYESMGPLWRSVSPGFASDIMSVPLVQGYTEKAGISLASTTTGWGIIEYDDARSYQSDGRDYSQSHRPYKWIEKDDRFDFEVIFNVNTRHGKNEHELYFAYDNVDFASEDGRGSIGLQGFRGPIYSRGPLSGYLGQSYAFNDLEQKIQDDLIICYDYYGPESSQFEVTIWTQVKRNAIGTDQIVTATSSVSGMSDFNMTHTLAAPSNIDITTIGDMETAENTSVDVNVYYADNSELVTANEIIVAGEFITAEVASNKSGSVVTITPDANFHGETLVTVTVADIENPMDKASTSFTLMVESDGVELGCTNSAATNYDANANQDDGSCTLPVTPEAEDTSSSGGSTGFAVFALMLIAAMRRRLNAPK